VPFPANWSRAAAFCLLPLTSFAAADADKEGIRLVGTNPKTTDNGITIIDNGPGTISFGDDLQINYKTISINRLTRHVTIPGEAQMSFGASRILARDASAQRSKDKTSTTITTQAFRMGMPPAYLQGESANISREDDPPKKISTTSASLNNITIHYQEPELFGITVDARKISISQVRQLRAKPTEDRPADTTPQPPQANEEPILRVEDAVLRVANLPIFYLPAYEQQGLDLPPIRPVLHVGSQENIGEFLRTTLYYTALKRSHGIEPGILLDAYSRAGVLCGPTLLYDTERIRDHTSLASAIPAKGEFLGAWINDNSARGNDNYNTPIDAHRSFLLWNHKQDFHTSHHHLELTASINYWSDTSVLRDFRPAEFSNNQRPDNFVELVLPDPAFYLSLFSRFRANDFQNVQQRLPELRLDYNPREIGSSGIFHQFSLAFAFLYERTSPEFPILPGAPGGTLESPRLDTYYGFTRPIHIGDWLSITPVAGARATTYFSPQNNGVPYSRLLPQLGFDIHLNATGQWNLHNAIWEIDGLRHRLRPLVQYRWIPAADKGREHIPAIDRTAFIPYPLPIDLSQKRYTDDLWEQQVLRIGIENILQTRDPDYGSRDLAWLNIYQDFYDNTRPGDRTRSTTYSQLGISPARWLNLELYSRLDTYSWRSNEISAQLELRDGDRWNLRFGAQYNTDISTINQYYWSLEYRVSSNYALFGRWRYDCEADKLTEQYYGLRQRIGNTWIIEYHLANRQNARRDNGFSYGINLRIQTF
jgi:LPS-assembly protein